MRPEDGGGGSTLLIAGFERHDVSPGTLSSQAEAVAAPAGDVESFNADLSKKHNTAREGVAGVIATAMEGADTPTKNQARDLIQGITIGAGAIRLFGTAVETFNGTVDRLNSQIRAELTRDKQLEKKAALSGQHAGAVETLQSAARTAKGQLSDPLDPKNVKALYAAGALPAFAPATFSNVVDLTKVKLKALPYDVANLSAQEQAQYVVDHAKNLDAQFIAMLSPAVRGLVANLVAEDIRTKAIDADTVATLTLMQDDAAFAHRLYSTVTPNEMADAIQHLSSDAYGTPSGGVQSHASAPPPPDKEAIDLYRNFLAAAGGTMATYSLGTGQYAPPADAGTTWGKAICDEDNPENAAAISLLLRSGGHTNEFEAKFLSSLANEVYEYEREHAGDRPWGSRGDDSHPPVYDPYPWGMDKDPLYSTYGRAMPDAFANVLASMEKSPDAAQKFFTTDAGEVDKDKLDYLIGKKDGNDVDARTFSARYGSDEGNGLGLALEAATVGGGDREVGAAITTDVFKKIADLSGHGAGGVGPDAMYDSWHVWPKMTDSLGAMASGYTDDIYDLLSNTPPDKGPTHLDILPSELEKVLGEIGNGDDKTGLQTLTAAMLLECNEATAEHLKGLNGPKTLDALEGTGLEGVQATNGDVMGNLLNKGLAISTSEEELAKAREELLSKAFDVTTGFLPGGGRVLGETASEFAKTSYDTLQGEALDQLKSTIASSPSTDGYLDGATGDVDEKLKYGAINELYRHGYLGPQDVTGIEEPFKGVPKEILIGDPPQIRPDLYDKDGWEKIGGDDMSDAERTKIQQAWQEWRNSDARSKIDNLSHQTTFMQHFIDPTVR
ncbi:hypothetical protein [Mumia quercus]|uniref:hypothetical protein n=1 Tax=Mumia quercus TaxID=2976125 RepID=UPI0021D09D78|nr:hypothetical protein [Mumia quercus]